MRLRSRTLTSFGWKKSDPESSAELINALIERGLDEHEEALSLLLANLADLLIVLTPDSRDRLRAAVSTARKAITGESEADKRASARFESAYLTLQLYDAEPADQSSLVLSHGIDTGHAEGFSLYRPIALADIIQVDLENVPASHLANWLGYIVELLSKEDIAKLDFLPKLMTHGDQRVRHEALVLAAHGHHLSALTVFAASPYAAPPNREDKLAPRHEYWRNRALLELCAFAPNASLSERLNPESVALIAEQRPTDPDAP